ncbi:Short-chain dehydrogenase/reductase SDR OS=Tsukamurella paurometabola (strain ATCC 8368 / DSM/ CCUG 35730 / CIP 100753 / JCM 10117 / KCTC 9821 / NBRC 16120/ NCIMB 702349 / NCTC 13040) OX=521096 GN=Tpau_4205 PE=3 SV=1 [Tsukamurella paurometabola]|uniref:Short-chain dehydrogenase/reductase SDR n=1 Tax=Tsukamurella paurometabola (strain ATCC 8368 / DSM 20162 / CCUG 35730 / CIP 100753 / JCM 10117 / KCTC 9821 / NBRC 16120 / NCIMB 702349 / NCTC 13040) TaxID=521096 RepID=D5UP64_TSUPD|nr:SDR family oxidoreductase [Tsukamurella paurometabola]ADG80773.1 short-chain dehydrogenase/reductase SDR [Tsukamurella paurometabola DSM 20162]SUP40929.1 Benzil reductase [Tsukamurella paurometabola]
MSEQRPLALITGASRGLGAQIARQLADTHDLLLGGRPSPGLDALAAELGALTFAADLTDHSTVAALAQSIPRLDVLVHNAGIASIARIEDTTATDWRTMFEVNLLAVVELTKALLPALREANGHVVLINSGAGKRANPGWGAYAASKFGLTSFAEALRAEEPALRVTSVFPGRIDTRMQEGIFALEGRDYSADNLLRPETVARAVVHAVHTPADAHPTEIVLRPR